MATVAENTARSASAPGAHDRLFYSGIAVAMAGTVFAGFAPTYYLRSYFGAPVTVTGATTLSVMAHIHGALSTAWVLLFVVQTALVAGHRTRVHRRLGVAGGVLAAAMVIVGVAAAVGAAARGSAPPGVDPLAFLSVPLFDIGLFGVFVVTALWRRRDREAHKRLMLMAYVSMMAAAVARLPGLLAYGPLAFFALAFSFMFAGVVYDIVSRGRIHPAYKWGGSLLVLSVPGRLMLSGTGAWRAFAEFLTRSL